jgi:hypothetical protein
MTISEESNSSLFASSDFSAINFHEIISDFCFSEWQGAADEKMHPDTLSQSMKGMQDVSFVDIQPRHSF